MIHFLATLCGILFVYAVVKILDYFFDNKDEEPQENMMTVIHQQWYKERRALIIDREHFGTVHVSVPDADLEDNRIQGKADALIYSLWVDEHFRGNGVGRKLLKRAEWEAKIMGCKSVCLEWDCRETPEWVLRWYKCMEYDAKRIDDFTWLLTKDL